jgi:ribosomal protein S18 acetylase RimI-like enzyme
MHIAKLTAKVNGVLSVQRITPLDIEIFKAVRLRALQDTPFAFGSTYEHEAAFSEEEWRARIQRWDGQTGAGFLAIEANAPCGIAGALLDQSDCSRAELVSMWTAPTHRRKGVGGLLVASVITWARSREVRTVRLMVTNANQTAIRFYRQLGFALTGRTEPYPNDPALEELEMALSIT